VRFKYHSIHQNYTFIEKLGEGSYGIVYKVQSKQTGEVRAAKIFKKSKISESEKAKLMNEINILRKLDHPNIIKIY
jgi:calcium-dependent protein kinase